MLHIKHLMSFVKDENGAVTVDWVVLTAAIAALGLAVAITVGTSTKDLADDVSTYIDSADTLTY